jgi:SNF2-related domain
MGNISVSRLDDGRYALRSSYFSKALVDHAKAVPGVRYNRDLGHAWVGYIDAVSAVVARLRLQGIRVDGDLPAADAWKTATTLFVPATAGLRDYQNEGVKFLLAKAREGALLADAMRLGKSCVATTAARALKQKTLVVCLSHGVGVWARPRGAPEGPGEIAKWWPDAWNASPSAEEVVGARRWQPAEKVMRWLLEPARIKPLAEIKQSDVPRGLDPEDIATDVPHDGTVAGDLSERWEGSHFDPAKPGVVCLSTVKPAKETPEQHAARAAALESANVIVCHYDILYAWVPVLLAWGVKFLILDEVHIVASFQSRRSKALKQLAEAAVWRVGLTGTPITGALKTAHNVFDLLSPGRFGYFFAGVDPVTAKIRTSYAKTFCQSHQETVGKGEHQITIWRHDGRLNMDVPDGEIAITQEETLHDRLAHFMLRRLKKEVDRQLPQKTRQIIDVTVPANRTVSLSRGMLGGDGAELRSVLDQAADFKLPTVVALVRDHLGEGEKVLCFCYRRLFAERVAAEIKKKNKVDLVEFVHGGMLRTERDKRIHRVRKHDGPAVLCCTIDTTSTSIDLSFAEVAVVAELVWDAFELSQLEERLYEYGKDAKALIQYVIARGTGDELILRGVIQKMDTSERAGVKAADDMKEELGARKGDPMKRLFNALVAMQKASGQREAVDEDVEAPTPMKKRRRRAPALEAT